MRISGKHIGIWLLVSALMALAGCGSQEVSNNTAPFVSSSTSVDAGSTSAGTDKEIHTYAKGEVPIIEANGKRIQLESDNWKSVSEQGLEFKSISIRSKKLEAKTYQSRPVYMTSGDDEIYVLLCNPSNNELAYEKCAIYEISWNIYNDNSSETADVKIDGVSYAGLNGDDVKATMSDATMVKDDYTEGIAERVEYNKGEYVIWFNLGKRDEYDKMVVINAGIRNQRLKEQMSKAE